MSTSTSDDANGDESGKSESTTSFKPTDRTKDTPAILLPDELWLTILESPCTFPADVFSGVMLNLIKNPNITSSHLFRADIFFDTEQEYASGHDENLSGESLAQHLEKEYQPLNYDLPGFKLGRTIVRQLVPRNPQLDRPLLQTCHFFDMHNEREERKVVVYIPHVHRSQDTPFYHPMVSRLAFEHRWQISDPEAPPTSLGEGSISISYCLFPDTTLTTKLERTALNLLQTIHKHGQGQLAGYEKRVHLDQVVPQGRYQDTYTRLKTKYGKKLAEQWVCQSFFVLQTACTLYIADTHWLEPSLTSFRRVLMLLLYNCRSKSPTQANTSSKTSV